MEKILKEKLKHKFEYNNQLQLCCAQLLVGWSILLLVGLVGLGLFTQLHWHNRHKYIDTVQ